MTTAVLASGWLDVVTYLCTTLELYSSWLGLRSFSKLASQTSTNSTFIVVGNAVAVNSPLHVKMLTDQAIKVREFRDEGYLPSRGIQGCQTATLVDQLT